MNKKPICLWAATVLGALMMTVAVQAQTPAAGTPAAAPQPSRPRIALVNIAKVLREFNKANYDGQVITKKRQEFVNKAQPIREKIATLGKTLQTTQVASEREKIQREIQALNNQLADLEMEAQRVLPDLTDRTIVDVYQNIKQVITDIAVTNNLDLVMCYPDASSPEEDKKPAVAQLKLQSPALMPMYHRNMDITDVVILTLNKRHPAPANPVSSNMVPPMGGGNVTPVSGPGPAPKQ